MPFAGGLADGAARPSRWAASPPRPTVPVVTRRSPGRAPCRGARWPGRPHPSTVLTTARVAPGFVSPPTRGAPDRAAARSAPRTTSWAHRRGVPGGTIKSRRRAAGSAPLAARSERLTFAAAAPIRAGGESGRKWVPSTSASVDRTATRFGGTRRAAASSPTGTDRAPDPSGTEPATRGTRARPTRRCAGRGRRSWSGHLYGRNSLPRSSRPRMIRMMLRPPSAPTR